MKIAAIEAGGTKFVCGIVTSEGELIERITIPTTGPEETMKAVIDYFKTKEFSCMGIGSFGPIDLNKNSKTYGYITATPKLKWKHYNIVGKLKEHFSCPIGFDTDVNGAALGELMFGAAKDVNSCVYLTVGTGIGGGAVIDRKTVSGLMHPEMGHILIKRHPEDKYEGTCPYHKDCLEGLAAGPAIEKRFGKPGAELNDNEKVWELESYYLAQGLMNYVLTMSPEKIIMGGGVMHHEGLHQQVHQQLIKLLNDYVGAEELFKDNYVCPPKLGDNAGIIGCAMVGLQEMQEHN